MIDLRIAEISSSSGVNNDGVVRGNINRSTLIATYSNLLLATNVYAVRRDSTGTTTINTNLDAEAVSEVDNSFLPWGDDTNFSGDDEIWIADGDKAINEIYVQITTPGVWNGTGLSVLESIDGDTLTAVGGLVDGSNGFRNATGIYKISFNANSENRKAIAYQFGATKRKYIVLRPNGFTSKTTAPKLRRIWLVSTETNNEWANVTADINDDLTDSDFGVGVTTNIFPIVGSESRIGFRGLTLGVYDAVYRGIASNYTVVAEYLASDDVWRPLPDYVDPSNNFTNASTTLSTTPTYYTRKWSIPSDWNAKTLTFGTTQVTAYWVRRRITAVSTYGPLPLYLYRRRSLSFGDGLAYGIYHRDAASYNYVTYLNGTASTTDMVISITNAITGQSQKITIPANSTDSGSLPTGRLDFPGTLNIGAGHHLLISHVSGTGTILDCELRLMEN